jgi:hypothetical protein
MICSTLVCPIFGILYNSGAVLNVRHLASDALTDHFGFRLFETAVLIMRMRHPVLTAVYFFCF